MKKTFHLTWFLVTDFAGAFLAWITFFSLRKNILGELPENVIQAKVLIPALFISLFWMLIYLFFGLYKELYRRSRIKDIVAMLGANFIGAVIVFFVLLLDDQGVSDYTLYYKTFALYFLTQSLFTFTGRVFIISRIKKLIRSGKIVFNTIIVGADKSAYDIYQEINTLKDLGFRFIGFLHVNDVHSGLVKGELRDFGLYKNLNKLIRRAHVDQVIIAIEATEHKIIQEILTSLEGVNVKIGIIPDMYQLLLGAVKANQLLDIPLIEINPEIIPQWQQILKRFMDVSISFFVLLLGIPFFLIVAFITKYSSKGPVFYRQLRIGKGGKAFHIIKFRSMYINSEMHGPALASDVDTRITGWGRIMRRFRIDELPQFYNILLGDMSLVGPRPERQYFIDQIIELAPEYKHLQKVRPGLTSLGQVKFGYAENVAEMVKRLKYDVYYIENMSIAMDLKIILYTILIIIQGRGK